LEIKETEFYSDLFEFKHFYFTQDTVYIFPRQKQINFDALQLYCIARLWHDCRLLFVVRPYVTIVP